MPLPCGRAFRFWSRAGQGPAAKTALSVQGRGRVGLEVKGLQEGGIAGQGLKSQLWGKGRGEKERILLPPPENPFAEHAVPWPLFPVRRLSKKGACGRFEGTAGDGLNLHEHGQNDGGCACLL